MTAQSQVAYYGIAAGAIFLLIVLGHFARKFGYMSRARKYNSTRFKRIYSTPTPVTLPPPVTSTHPRPSTSTPDQPIVTGGGTRAPVFRTDSDPTLPVYTTRDLSPPAPTYNPVNPLRAGRQSLTPNSLGGMQPVTYPLDDLPTLTPYLPTPPASQRPPSYRSGHSQGSVPRLGAIGEEHEDGSWGGDRPVAAPPGYETVMRR